MPQLVKGGKHAFGWSRVSEAGKITIPPEAFEEYGFAGQSKMLLVPGSKTSGGFGLAGPAAFRKSPLSGVFDACPDLAEFRTREGTVVEHNGKSYCWVALRDCSFVVPIETLAQYGVKPGDDLLSVRGSSLALGFIARGPIVEEASKHPDLERFQ